MALDEINSYIESNRQLNIDLKDLTAEDLIKALNNKEAKRSSLEIAWGLLDALIRHKSDHPFITCCFEVAKRHLADLGPNSTIVLDAHGGGAYITCGDYERMQKDVLATTVVDILSNDKKQTVDHVILQCCKTGTLKLEDNEDYFLKENAALGKKSLRVITSRDAENIFQKNSTAHELYKGLQTLRKPIAFSFSENLINPANRLGQGNLGIPGNQVNVPRVTWPENVSSQRKGEETINQREHWKRATIVPTTVNYRKSLEKYSIFKKEHLRVRSGLWGAAEQPTPLSN